VTDTPQPYVFDHTALVALMASNDVVLSAWYGADRGERQVVLPPAALAAANHRVGATWSTWSVLLYPPNVNVVPLDGKDAVETGLLAGSLAVRHATRVAADLRGVVVTATPWQYVPNSVSLLTF
jgi:hypothetical protein